MNHNPENLHYYLKDNYGAVESVLSRINMIGPLVTIDYLKNHNNLSAAAQIADGVIDRVRKRHNVSEQIYFAIVQTSAVNAVAISNGGAKLDCIVISTGMLTIIASSVRKLLGSTYFRMIWSGQDFPPIPTPPTRSRQDAIRDVFFEDVDPNLREEETILWQFCLEFIVLHELGHIINGHTRIDALQSACVYEISPDVQSDRLTRRTFEMDADNFAVNQHLIRLKEVQPLEAHHPAALFLLDDRARLLTFMASIAPIIFMFEAHHRDAPGTYLDNTHPPAYIRNWICLAHAKTYLASWISRGESIPSDYEEILVRAHVGAFLAIADLGQAAFSLDESKAWHDAVPLHDEANLRRWAELRPRLEKVKYGNHALAPAQY
jgi:hypothetical protein